jgi:excisionase family DNA binding protein
MPVIEQGPIAASENEQPALREIDRMLEKSAHSTRSPMLVGPNGEQIPLPPTLFQALKRTVAHLTHGQAVTIIPINKEVTTQEAADILNISRPYLVRMLEEGKIPYNTVGTHRRIPLNDLLDYKQQRDEERLEAIREIAQISQEAGMYD